MAEKSLLKSIMWKTAYIVTFPLWGWLMFITGFFGFFSGSSEDETDTAVNMFVLGLLWITLALIIYGWQYIPQIVAYFKL